MNDSRTFALVNDGDTVESVVIWDGLAAWLPPRGLRAIACPPDVAAGWCVENDVFVPPPREGE